MTMSPNALLMTRRSRWISSLLTLALASPSLGCGSAGTTGAGGGSSTISTTGAGGGSSTISTTGTGGTSGAGGAGGAVEAFFYQFVGMGQNAVRAGTSGDGVVVHGQGTAVVSWAQGPGTTSAYGDPVISRLPDGRFTMTSWTGPNDARGAFRLLYHESACPQVSDAAVHVIAPASGPGCMPAPNLMMAKSSQVFAAEGGLYLFLMNGGRVYLAHLEDATHPASALASICLRQQKAPSLAALAAGEATEVLGPAEAPNLLLSDTAIARRADGTWVLFVKGIVPQMGCGGGNLCELCSRKIYRTTSVDLLAFSPLEAVVSQASIPEASAGVDGKVRLYFQDFSDTCAESNLMKAPRAPISMVREDDDHTLGAPVRVSFPDEGFEADPMVHYATNGNPVALPDAAALAAFEACIAK
ncbi:MAG: hypothetical protein U0359_09995 [Byssovorax sp.]